jgi:phosphocarrier protein FPr
VVGIVVVAHSKELADSVIALTREMLREDVPLAAAGGIDDGEHPFGTDVHSILTAIESVYSNHGVLVLMDMGSALLSAETAMDFLTDEQRGNVMLSEAPLIEGAVSAAVCAEGGGSLEEVSNEARASLQPKREQLSGVGETEILFPEVITGKRETIRVTVVNALGIHARPAAALVTTASRFESTITIAHAGHADKAVTARSINAVSLLGARQGDELELCASGSDARAALEALRSIIENGFGEKDRHLEDHGIFSTGGIRKGGGMLSGTGASPGVAIAPGRLFQPHTAGSLSRKAGNPGYEWNRLASAIDAVKLELKGMKDGVEARSGAEQASIFQAHSLVLEDDQLLESVRSRIHTEKVSAEQAFSMSLDDLLKQYSRLESPYQRERGRDLEDIRRLVLTVLTGRQLCDFELDHEAIVIAPDLSPSDVALLDSAKVRGVCTAYGGATSHSAILARALGIPAVVGVGPDILRVPEGTAIAIDGKKGTVWIDPDEAEQFTSASAAWFQSRSTPVSIMQDAAATLDGKKIRVFANISSVIEARRASQLGADGIGVLRTEFLFIHRAEPPSEQEQVEIYRSIAEAMGRGPLVIRTLDAGGDKPLSYIPMKAEANPFLGLRGLRLMLEHPDLYRTQLRAILRAGKGYDVSVLLPMVSSTEEIIQAKQLLQQVRDDLAHDKLDYCHDVKLGIMIEVPAAALIAASLAKEVDFMSIGTNDLSQYVMSADRGSEQVSSLCDPLHPAVLQLVEKTSRACRESGLWAGVCGEVAADVQALPLLLGLGIQELSMNPHAIPNIKAAVSKLDSNKVTSLATRAVQLGDGRQVRQLLSDELGFGQEEEGSEPYI